MGHTAKSYMGRVLHIRGSQSYPLGIAHRKLSILEVTH